MRPNVAVVIRSFRHKGLRTFHRDDDPSLPSRDLVPRIRGRLSALESASTLEDLNIPGFDLHKLRGKPVRYSAHVNGPWCITFEWSDGEALRVDLENDHERKSAR